MARLRPKPSRRFFRPRGVPLRLASAEHEQPVASPARELYHQAGIALAQPSAYRAPDYDRKWPRAWRLVFPFAASGLLWAAIIGLVSKLG